jgi:hypothetical protein
MRAVAARLTMFVEQDVSGRGDDAVGQRQLTGAARVAAMNDPGCGMFSLDLAKVEMILAGELFGGQAGMGAEDDDRRDGKHLQGGWIEWVRRTSLGLGAREETKA